MSVVKVVNAVDIAAADKLPYMEDLYDIFCYT
jgi:hypothetical protein